MRVFTFKVSFSWLFKLCFLESLAKAQVRVWKSKSFFNKKKRFQGDFFHEIKAEIDYFPRTSSPLTLEVSGYTQFHLIDISIERLKSLTLFDWRIQNSPFLIPIRELSGRKTVPTYLFQSSSHISWCLLQKVWVEARGKVMSRSENRCLLNRYIVKAQSNLKLLSSILNSDWTLKRLPFFPYRLSRLWIGFIFGSHFSFPFLRQFSFHFSCHCSFRLLLLETAHDHHVKFIIHEFGWKREVCAVLMMIHQPEKREDLILDFVCCRLLQANQWKKLASALRMRGYDFFLSWLWH